jgi:hypothetical protein
MAHPFVGAMDRFSELQQEILAEVLHLAHRGRHPQAQSIYTQLVLELTQVERRCLVRSVFAALEALAFSMKQLAATWPYGNSLSPAEQAMCLEHTYQIDDKGKAKERKAKLPFTNNIRFSLLVSAKVVGLPCSANFSDSGWVALLGSREVRNRITHPNTPTDLNISDDELQTVITGFRWAMTRYSEAMQGLRDVIQESIATRKRQQS